MWKVQGTSILSEHSTLPKSPPVHQPRRSPNPSFWVLMEALLHIINNSLSHWPLEIESTFSLSALPGERGKVWDRIRNSNPLFTVLGYCGNQPSSLVTQGLSESHLINITKDTFNAFILENSNCSRTSVPGMGLKTKYIFRIKNHNITFTLSDTQ